VENFRQKPLSVTLLLVSLGSS